MKCRQGRIAMTLCLALWSGAVMAEEIIDSITLPAAPTPTPRPTLQQPCNNPHGSRAARYRPQRCRAESTPPARRIEEPGQ